MTMLVGKPTMFGTIVLEQHMQNTIKEKTNKNRIISFQDAAKHVA